MADSPFTNDDNSQFQSAYPWDAPTPGRVGSMLSPSSASLADECSPAFEQPCLDRLGFIPLDDWEEGRSYDEQPPSYIRYSIEWKVTLNNRVMAKDTEQDLTLAPSAYWQQVLKEKPDNVLRRKISYDRRVRLDDTTLVVSVNDRSQRDLTKRFDNTDINWAAIEEQLLKWGSLFQVGKKLRLAISFNYIGDSHPARKGDKRGTSSVTQRMQAERDTQIDAEHASGQHSVWREVYRTMRCPGPPCAQGAQYCWQDPAGKKHYRLRTHHLRSLVKYVEQGGVLETHDDVPDTIREQLYAEESLERQRKAKQPGIGSTCPININVLPAQSPHHSVLTAPSGALAAFPPSRDARHDPISIPGRLDVAVEEYSNWHQSRVSSEILKDDIKKARDVALANGLDLNQIHEDQDPGFFIENGVKVGVARRFASDIGEWVKQL